MKRFIFKLVRKIITWYHNALDKDARDLSRLLDASNVPDRQTSLNEKRLANWLRDDSKNYHYASVLWAREHNHREVGGFDKLHPEEKQLYIKRAAQAYGT